MAQKKTGFDSYFEEKMRSPAFAKAYKAERATIDAVDEQVRRIVCELEAARCQLGLTKAKLAKECRSPAESVRRLLTSDEPNPTLTTVVSLALAMGFDIQVVPRRATAAKPAKRRAKARVRARG